MDTLIECGRIGRTFGVKGDLVVHWNNKQAPVSVEEVLFIGQSVQVTNEYCVAALRQQGRSFIVQLTDITNRELAKSLTGQFVYLPESHLTPLASDEYYCYQLLGMNVVTDAGIDVGKVVHIFSAGENDVYEVSRVGMEGKNVLIPAIVQVIKEISVSEKRIIIYPINGLLDEK